MGGLDAARTAGSNNEKAQNKKRMTRRMHPTLNVFVVSRFILSPHPRTLEIRLLGLVVSSCFSNQYFAFTKIWTRHIEVGLIMFGYVKNIVYIDTHDELRTVEKLEYKPC